MGDKKQLFNKFMDAEYEYNYVYLNMFGLVSSNVFGLVSRTYDFRGNVDDKESDSLCRVNITGSSKVANYEN